MVPRTTVSIAVLALCVGVIGIAVAVGVVHPPEAQQPPEPTGNGGLDTLDTFDSAAEFRAYVDREHRLAGGAGAMAGVGGATQSTPVRVETARPTAASGDGGGGSGAAPAFRVGSTNVQVAGLSEPDRVKSYGSTLFYAPRGTPVALSPTVERVADGEDGGPQGDVIPPEPPNRSTHIVDASDPSDPALVADINATGTLLRSGDRLVMLGDASITGYDVSDPADPTELWSRPLNDALVTARERNGTIFVVTKTPVEDEPCPLRPIGGARIACTDVHHPRSQIEADVTYTAMALDASSGDIGTSVSFVGTDQRSVVYMAHDALYVTYTKRTSRAELAADFLVEDFDRTPDAVANRIRQLRSYDISSSSLRRETGLAVRSWLQSLDEEERRAVRSALQTEFSEYLANHQRDLARTGIVRVDVDADGLAIGNTTSVPGKPLDQFSLDRRNGELRIATTVPAAGNTESVADLTILDADSLDVLGTETGMGKGQRIYAVRYVEDTAYLITFRRVDPLHVVDLSDPTSPTEVGTLKLPGFSNYLHPIDGDYLLGVGQEEGRVKVVLFDVSDPENPTVADDMLIGASHSAVSRTHHAFMIDRKHGVVFVPAGGVGQVLNYTNGTLERTKAVPTEGQAERARYVGDYLYVFGTQEIAVVDERDWSRQTSLSLG
ncbi:MAG: beta-propeller domain-containing protein [Salinirussus sp.]